MAERPLASVVLALVQRERCSELNWVDWQKKVKTAVGLAGLLNFYMPPSVSSKQKY